MSWFSKREGSSFWHLSLMPFNSTLELLNRWSVSWLQRTCSFQNSSLSHGKPYPGSFVTKGFSPTFSTDIYDQSYRKSKDSSASCWTQFPRLPVFIWDRYKREEHHCSLGLGAWVQSPKGQRKTVGWGLCSLQIHSEIGGCLRLCSTKAWICVFLYP